MSCHVDVENLQCGYSTTLAASAVSDDGYWTCGVHDGDALVEYPGGDWTGAIRPETDTAVTLVQDVGGSDASVYDPIVSIGECGADLDVSACPNGPWPSPSVQPPAARERVEFTADGTSTYYLTVDATDLTDPHDTTISVECLSRYFEESELAGTLRCNTPVEIDADPTSDSIDEYAVGEAGLIPQTDPERIYVFTAPATGAFHVAFTATGGSEVDLFGLPPTRRSLFTLAGDYAVGTTAALDFSLQAGGVAYVVVEGDGTGTLEMQCSGDDTAAEPDETDGAPDDKKCGCASANPPAGWVGVALVAMAFVRRRATCSSATPSNRSSAGARPHRP